MIFFIEYRRQTSMLTIMWFKVQAKYSISIVTNLLVRNTKTLLTSGDVIYVGYTCIVHDSLRLTVKINFLIVKIL